MAIPDPSPSYLCLSALGLPGAFLLASGLARKAFGSKEAAALSVPGFTILLFTLMIHIVGIVTRQFYPALLVGSAIVGLTGLGLWRSYPATFSAMPIVLKRRTIISSAVASLPVVWLVTVTDLFDKKLYQGHYTATNNILNGFYPPRTVWMPSLDLAYHYGIDTLFAISAAMFRLDVEVAVGIVMVGCWFYSMLLFSHIIERISGRNIGWIAAPVAAFCGGFLPLHHLMEAVKTDVNPGLFTYFFQNPWTFGIPLALLVITQLLDIEEKRAGKYAWLSFFFLFCGLGIFNMTEDLAFGAASIFVLVWTGISTRAVNGDQARKQLLLCAAAVCAAMVLGIAAGGIASQIGSAVSARSGSVIRFSHGGIDGDLLHSLVWNIETFGALLPLGVIGIFAGKRLRLFSILVVAGGFFVVNIFEYTLSWDIVKFATITYLVLGIMASIWLWSPNRKPIVRYIGIALLLIDSADWISSATYHAFPHFFGAHDQAPGSPQYDGDAVALWRSDFWTNTSPDDRAAIFWLRSRIAPDELVARREPISLAYAALGGLPEADFFVEPHAAYPMFHVPRKLVDLHLNLMAHPPEDAAAFREEGIRWIVADRRAVQVDALLKPALSWVQRGQADIKAQFGSLVVIHLR